jgi:hypothetical protein
MHLLLFFEDMCVCMYVCMYVYTFICMYASMYICTYTCVRVYVGNLLQYCRFPYILTLNLQVFRTFLKIKD